MSTSRVTTPSRSAVSPSARVTGASSPSPATWGCNTARIDATTIRSGGRPVLAGCVSRRSTARRCPTVSARGDSRSWGRVSQLGKTATTSGPSRLPSADARSSASRPVATTARTGWSAPTARAAAAKGRNAAGPARSRTGSPTAPIARPRAGSPPGRAISASSNGARVMGCVPVPLGWLGSDSDWLGSDDVTRQGRSGPDLPPGPAPHDASARRCPGPQAPGQPRYPVDLDTGSGPIPGRP